MSRIALESKPEFADHSVHVGYEKQAHSFFAYVFAPDGIPIVIADGLDAPITEVEDILDVVRPYALIPEHLPAILAGRPAVELTATDQARR